MVLSGIANTADFNRVLRAQERLKKVQRSLQTYNSTRSSKQEKIIFKLLLYPFH